MIKNHHKATLKRLVNGSRTENELTTGDMNETQHAKHTVNRLEDCQVLGYCVKIGDEWHLTDAGREVIETKAEKASKRITSWSVGGVYDGWDLRDLANRPNAYDYRKCPSIINGERVFK